MWAQVAENAEGVSELKAGGAFNAEKPCTRPGNQSRAQFIRHKTQQFVDFFCSTYFFVCDIRIMGNPVRA